MDGRYADMYYTLKKSHYVQEIVFATICAGREITISNARREECACEVCGVLARNKRRDSHLAISHHMSQLLHLRRGRATPEKTR